MPLIAELLFNDGENTINTASYLALFCNSSSRRWFAYYTRCTRGTENIDRKERRGAEEPQARGVWTSHSRISLIPVPSLFPGRATRSDSITWTLPSSMIRPFQPITLHFFTSSAALGARRRQPSSILWKDISMFMLRVADAWICHEEWHDVERKSSRYKFSLRMMSRISFISLIVRGKRAIGGKLLICYGVNGVIASIEIR